MPRLDYKTCKRCKRKSSEVGELSHQRLCSDCGAANLIENVMDLVNHSGPNFARWRIAIAASVGGVLLDAGPFPDNTLEETHG